MKIGLRSWKYIFCVPILVALLVVTGLIPLVIHHYSTHTAVEVGTNTLDQIQAIRNFYTKYILTEALLAGIETDTDHRESAGTIPAPATFTHNLSEVISETGTQANLYSPFPWPNRSERVLDARQQAAWDFLTANPDAIYHQFATNNAGKAIVYVAKADKLTSETCVDCHNNHPDTPIAGWSLNDTRGVLEIAVDVESLISRGHKFGYGLTGIMLLLMIFTLALGFGIDFGIGKPLIAISSATLTMLKGTKTPIPHKDRRDEVGDLARSLEKLTGYMKDHEKVLTLEAEQTHNKVARTERLEKLMNSFDDKINITFENISASIKKIYDSTGYLSTNAEETSSQITLISSATDQMAQNISSVSESGGELSKSIITVLQQVNQSRNISEDASSQANDANQKIQGLANAAQRIGEVVSLINDIANQTNLLALNATIEAARAGESGKGFAVVANEVKNLASQTAKATDEISSQIQNIQAETQHAVAAIAQVAEVVTNINTLSSDIADSIDSQTNAVHEISNNAQQTTTGTNEVTQGLVSVSTAATSTGTMAATLFSDAENLRRLAEELGAEIKDFHMKIIEIQNS